MTSEITYKVVLTKEEMEQALAEYCNFRGLLPIEFSWSVKNMKIEGTDAVIQFRIGQHTDPEDHEHDTLTRNEIPIPLCNECKGHGCSFCEKSS